METIGGLLLLAAIVAVIYYVQKALARGVGMVAGAVTGNTRTRGLAAVHTRLDFSAPVPGPQIIERIRSTLELTPGGKFATGLKIGHLSEDGSDLIIVSGNPLMTHLQYVVSTEPATTGCQGMATVANWVEDAGLVTTTEAIERIHKHVRSAVAHCGGSVTESSTKK